MMPADDAVFVNYHSPKRRVPLVVPDPIGVGNFANRPGDHGKAYIEIVPHALNIPLVPAAAQGNDFASGLPDLRNARLQLPELLTAGLSPVRVIEHENDFALASKLGKVDDSARCVGQGEVRGRLPDQGRSAPQHREREQDHPGPPFHAPSPTCVFRHAPVLLGVGLSNPPQGDLILRPPSDNRPLCRIAFDFDQKTC